MGGLGRGGWALEAGWVTRCKGRAGGGTGSWLASLRQRQVPAASGRRGGRGARRGRPGVTSASRSRARRRARPEQPGAPASPPPAEGPREQSPQPPSDSILWRDAPGAAAAFLRPEASAAACSPRSRSPSPPGPAACPPAGGSRHPRPPPALRCRGLPGGRLGDRRCRRPGPGGTIPWSPLRAE